MNLDTKYIYCSQVFRVFSTFTICNIFLSPVFHFQLNSGAVSRTIQTAYFSYTGMNY